MLVVLLLLLFSLLLLRCKGLTCQDGGRVEVRRGGGEVELVEVKPMDADAVESELMEIEGFDAVDADLMKVQAAGQDGGRVELNLCRAHGGPSCQGRAR